MRRRNHRRRRPWTAAEHSLLRRRYPHQSTKKLGGQIGRSTIAVYAQACKLGLRKTAAYLASACCLPRVGARTRFPPGHVPANKGLRRPGWTRGRMAETQFRKGSRPHTWQPIGATRITDDGYLQRKVTDTGYTPRDWVGEHVLLWTAAHGAPPPGHAVIFRDGDKRHVSLENLELVSRADLMRRNSIHAVLPPGLKAAVFQLGILRRALRRLEEGKEGK